jgi:endonuclease/exonuclease/phosphatase family metal-dependent hydrolase
MRILKKTILSLICITAVLIAVLFMDVGTAQGEARYRTSDLPPEILESDTLDLLTLNVAHGRGTALNQVLVSATQHRENLEEIASILLASRAQVVALQEADAPSLWSGKFDHVEYLAETTGYLFSAHGYHATAWPFTYGAALMSKSRMSDTHSHRFRPTWPTATKGYVRGTISWRNGEDEDSVQPVTLVSVHLDFSREEVRKAQIEELVDDLSELPTPLIIMGDFNADWSSDDSPVRQLANAIGLRAFRPTTQEFSTYKDIKRLDWILISDELKFIDYAVLPNIVSDHLAVVAKIGWEIHH